MYYVRPTFLTVGEFSHTKRKEARDWCAANGITKFMSSDLHPWAFKLPADADRFNKIFGTPDVNIMWRDDLDLSNVTMLPCEDYLPEQLHSLIMSELMRVADIADDIAADALTAANNARAGVDAAAYADAITRVATADATAEQLRSLIKRSSAFTG